MSTVSIICFCLCIFIILSCLRRGADIFSPGRVFGFVWLFSIGLTDLKLSAYQYMWSLYSWIVLTVSITAFLTGLLISFITFINKPIYSVSEIRSILHKEASRNIASHLFYRIIIILFYIYLISFCIEVMIEGNVPLFSYNVEKARVEFGVFGFHLLVNSMVTIMLLVIEYFLLIPNQKFKKIQLGFVFFLTSITFFLLLQRFNFFVWGVITLAFVYYSSKYLRFRNILIAGSIFGGLLMLIRSLRVTQYVEQYHYIVSKMKYSSAYAFLTEPYMYIVMNLENFARGVDNLENYFYGYFSIDWVLAVVGLKHWLADYFNIIERPFLISGYNTFPIFWPYYYDFGVLGAGCFSLIIGLIIGLLYYWMRSNPTIINTGLYAMAFFVMIISFFTNPLQMLNSAFNVVLWITIHIIIRKRHGNILLRYDN